MGEGDLVGGREQIAHHGEIASSIRAAVGELRCPVERGATADYDGPDRLPRMEPAAGHGGSWPSDSTIEIESAARESESRLVEKVGGKDVSFTQARHLLSQENVDQAERIGRGRMGFAVICGVDARERIFVGKDLVEPRRTKILPDVLPGICVRFGNTTRLSIGIKKLRPWGRHRPP